MAQHEVTAKKDLLHTRACWSNELSKATMQHAYHSLQANEYAARIGRAQKAIAECEKKLGDLQ